MEFSHKVFLIPNVGNNRSSDALAVEFVKFDELDSEVAEEYERTVALIKGRNIPVANLDLLRAGEVAQRVAAAIAPKQFTASHHHAKCWRYYTARPRKGASDPTNCNSKFCSYNKPHGDYLYTNAWVEFLISKMSDQETYERVMAAQR